MSYHHFTILFVIMFMAFGLKMQVHTAAYEAAAESGIEIERAFYAAADAAGAALCEYGSSGILTDKSAAYDAFIQSMYASLGILDDPVKREEFLSYIPMFAVLEEDGFYICFEDEYRKADGYSYQSRVWSECMPYSYSDEDFVYRFSLDGTVTIFDKNGLIDKDAYLYRLTQEELMDDPRFSNFRASRPDSFLFGKESFHIVKQTAVIKNVQEAMKYFVNMHNRTAQNKGIAYDFAIPLTDNADWSRTVEHPSVLIMIQGYPLSLSRQVYYNQYAFVGAQLYKDKAYYVTDSGWHLRYHREPCGQLEAAGMAALTTPIYSIEECVKLGAYACPECIPDGVYAPDTIYPIWSWEES